MAGLADEIRALAKYLREQGVSRFAIDLRFHGDEEEPEEERSPIGFIEHVGGDQLGMSDAEVDLHYEED